MELPLPRMGPGLDLKGSRLRLLDDPIGREGYRQAGRRVAPTFRGSAESLLKGLEAMRPTEVCLACETRSPVLCEESSKEASIKEANRRATEARMQREAKDQGDDLERFMKMLEGNVQHGRR